MDDPRGGALTESTHHVKTLDKARQWLHDMEWNQPERLPLKVTQYRAYNGRQRVEIRNNDGVLLMARG